MEAMLADLSDALRSGLIWAGVGAVVGALVGLIAWAVKKKPERSQPGARVDPSSPDDKDC